jgi:pentatricopeptide repeat protein
LTSEALAVIFEDSRVRRDVEFARRVEGYARSTHVVFRPDAYNALLKTYVVAGDARASVLFKEMQSGDIHIPDELCAGLLARCAESKCIGFAEELVEYIRRNSKMTLALYSVWMKVYANSSLYERACMLYYDLVADGFEPDAMMYGCLMKFAVECGKTDLAHILFDKAPELELQNCMSLIRAAGRDRNVDGAFNVLKRLKDSGVVVDIAAYNCVLNVCVTVGDL